MMWPMAQLLDDKMIADLAAFFWNQDPKPNTPIGDQELIARGQDYFQYGAPGVFACASCHGPHGQGLGTYPFPRLAGQNKDYVVSQLHAIQDGLRPESNVMKTLIPNLTDQEMEALGAYIQSLR